MSDVAVSRFRASFGLGAEQQKALYSITSSASASNLSGTVSPSALAVFRLMTSANLVGAREVGRPFALEDAIDVAGRAPVLVDVIGPIDEDTKG